MMKRQTLISLYSFLLLANSSLTFVISAPVPDLHQNKTPKSAASPIIQTHDSNMISKYWTLQKRRQAVVKEKHIHTTKQSKKNRVKEIKNTPYFNGEGIAPNHTRIPRNLLPKPIQYNSSEYPYPYMLYKTSALIDVYPQTTIGKLFVTIGNSDYVCSAAVIREHLLITARHCVFDIQNKEWATNVVFFPGYNNGVNIKLGPKEGWVARQFYTWVEGSDEWEYDIAFIQTFNYNKTGCAPEHNSYQIESYTGYLGYKYSGSYENRQFDIFGYPQANPFNGHYPFQCSTSTGNINDLVGNTFEAGCSMTGGASGGPWIENYMLSEAGSYNQLISITSFKWTNPDHPLSLNGPEFHAHNFGELLQGAMALGCP